MTDSLSTYTFLPATFDYITTTVIDPETIITLGLSSSTSTPTTLFTSPTPTLPSDFTVLTTPFSYPSTCDPHLLASLCRGNLPQALITATNRPDDQFRCVNTDEGAWLTCQPKTEWLENYAVTTYWNAVCPRGWWALGVGMSRSGFERGREGFEDSPRTISSARCCKSGDSLGDDIFHLYNLPVAGPSYGTICVQTWSTVSPTQSIRKYNSANVIATATVPWTTGLAYYPPWHISWTSTATSTLSPTWPTLTNNMLIPTWTPGMVIAAGVYDNRGSLTSTSSSRPTRTLDSDSGGQSKVDKAEETRKLDLKATMLLAFSCLAFTCFIGYGWFRWCRDVRRKHKKQQAEMARRRREHPYASEAQLESIRLREERVREVGLVRQVEILPSVAANYKYPWMVGHREMVEAPVKAKVRERELAMA